MMMDMPGYFGRCPSSVRAKFSGIVPEYQVHFRGCFVLQYHWVKISNAELHEKNFFSDNRTLPYLPILEQKRISLPSWATY
jgi:hypothetical protein